MSIKLQQLNHFVMVVEEGGFRAASQRANRSQAALSTSIKELEKKLGQSLFESGNKSTLTLFGEACLPKVLQFLDNYRRLESDLYSAADGQIGRVRIASVPSVAAKLLPSVLAEFCTKYPQVEVSLIDDNAHGVETRLLSGEVDLAVGNHSHYADANVLFTPILSDPIGVVCLESNALAQHKEGLKWQDLLSSPFISNGTCRLLEATPARVLSDNALYNIENITSLLSILEQGIGITTLPKLALPSHTTQLIWLPLVDPMIQRQIGIFQLSERTLSPPAQLFQRLCVEKLGGNKIDITGN
ncbi:LysR family transcriptional regulator [Vibrio profundum]|uniref:LysR family transcriptional regulator n=1 Tax=Vibrio profundum TaxID=2910247 RepID=UPI003D121961